MPETLQARIERALISMWSFANRDESLDRWLIIQSNLDGTADGLHWAGNIGSRDIDNVRFAAALAGQRAAALLTPLHELGTTGDSRCA